MKNKLSPSEVRRKKKALEYQRKYRAGKIDVDFTRSMGRTVGKRTKKHVTLVDLSSFCCPKCKNNISADLIRLRQGVYECRRCREIILRDDIIDSFDYDGLSAREIKNQSLKNRIDIE